MSYNPQTGLVYIPTHNMCMDLEGAEPKYKRGAFYLAVEFRSRQGGRRRSFGRDHRLGSDQAGEGVGEQR